MGTQISTGVPFLNDILGGGQYVGATHGLIACDHCGQLSLHSDHQNRRSTEVVNHTLYRQFSQDREHILSAISFRTFAFSC